MNIIFKIFLFGILILFFALITNLIAKYFNINTWYDFFEQIAKLGLINAIKEQGIINLIFLFLIYPMILGVIGYFSFSFLKF